MQKVRAALPDEWYTARNESGEGEPGGNTLRAGNHALLGSASGMSTFPDAGRSSLIASVEEGAQEVEARLIAETSTISIWQQNPASVRLPTARRQSLQ